MPKQANVLEYKCPCCNAALTFEESSQKMACKHCGNDFDMDTVKAFHEPEEAQNPFSWDDDKSNNHAPLVFQCPSCGAALDADSTTVSTFCEFCGNAVILADRTSTFLKPDAVLPFKTSCDDAKEAFQKLCKKKRLLPKDFMQVHRVEKISGHYVPFWLYSCDSQLTGKFRATRVRTWSDSSYRYTKTDHFLLTRGAKAKFDKIPMDGSAKMDDTLMESIEPFDYDQMVDFNNAYLVGYFADKYDVEAKKGESRIRQRVSTTMDEMVYASCVGYSSVVPIGKNLDIQHSKAKYVLLPVWMLQTEYKGAVYTFAMNGQSGKMTGTFPICRTKSLIWFGGVCAAVTALVSAILLLI